jgi:alpha,alpha-trehalose phosphorylase
VNADIAYALQQYAHVSGDLAFLVDEAAEVLVETARFWRDRGFFSARRGGSFCIHAVTGPDEYSAVVDDNAYTNVMARENLEGAARLVEWLGHVRPEVHARLGVGPEEVADWRAAAEAMHIPRSEELGILLQDERFLEREPWDLAGIPPERFPLLLHHHPLEIYRRQVVKQADAVLATYLAAHRFDADEIRRTFAFYEPLTTGDSTLSACIQSVVASAAGDAAAALTHFAHACTIDLADRHGNTADGLHVASCGGTWLALVAGFAGLRDFDGVVRLHPRLPREWTRLRFRLQVRAQVVEVDMTPAATTYTLLDGSGAVVHHEDERVELQPRRRVTVRHDAVLAEAA